MSADGLRPTIEGAAGDRPRERLLREGAGALADAELLALLLGSGARGVGAAGAARMLAERFPELRRMAVAGIAELCDVPGIGVVQACRIKAALALAGRLAERPFARGEPLGGPRDVFERIGRRLAPLEHEVFVALLLDVKQRVLAEQRVAEGGACSVEVVPRDLFARAVRESAVGVLFIHNHPSGDPSPSQADRELTERLVAAGRIVGVNVVDHVVVAQGGFYSFTEGRSAQAAT
ncbi:MAG: DNA repair protein RadC [Myxococcales bacterium]|nr:DNA repair protein RadC [Myxococcales bacterium]